MVRKSDGTLRRPAFTSDWLDVDHENTGDLVIEHEGVICETGPYVDGSYDLDPALKLSYEASLFALEDRLFLRVILRRDDWAHTNLLRISEDGGRTWQHVAEPPGLDAWRLVDHVEA